MLYIENNTTNRVIFTLNEKRVFADPVIFELHLFNKFSQTDTVIQLINDQSVSIDRWNQFDIDLSLYTLANGDYNYSVFEIKNADNNLVETGKCVIYEINVADDGYLNIQPNSGGYI